MNIGQRIVLIAGAIILWVILTHAGIIRDAQGNQLWDWKTGLVMGGFWCLTVAAIYFATAKKKDKP